MNEPLIRSSPTPGPIRHASSPSIPRDRWRDPQAWRLASGLVLFAFVLTHFLNHALGHVSLEAMEAAQAWRRGFWRSPPGTVLLFGALGVHLALALVKIATRRTWRMPLWEAAQLGLGVAIPILLAAHLAATRGLNLVHGFDDRYAVYLRLLWPGLADSQTLLLGVVWLHACLGLHHWLKTRPGYEAAKPALLVLAALIPVLATTGWIEAARRLALAGPHGPVLDEAGFAIGGVLITGTKAAVWWILGLTALAAFGVRLAGRLRRGPAVGIVGSRTVHGPRGATLLEICRGAGVPLASVCGGRGRCTTCRVQVVEGAGDLPAPAPVEAAALARIHAPAGVRLACQIRPEAPLAVRPLVRSREARPVAAQDPFHWGVERRITVMFTDIRGFTTLAERLYAYDSVFVLNRYFEVMSGVVRAHGGEIDKFLGDGIMALFGVRPAAGAGARDALFASRDMLAALEGLNREFAGTVGAPLRMGIGVHTGPAVLGRVGAERAMTLTALGDSVNIASRLEGLNRDFGSVLVVSQAALDAARLAIPDGRAEHVPVRGRGEGLRVVVAESLDGLREMEAPAAPAIPQGAPAQGAP